MLFNTPLSVGYGNGIGTPAGFAFATVILTIFSVGYVAMARKVTAAGGFYSFISHGLGRELGHGGGPRDGRRLLRVRGLAVRRLRVLRVRSSSASTATRLEWYWPALFMVALIGDPRVLRHPHLGARARHRADQRGPRPADLRRPGLRPGRREHPGGRAQPGQRLQEPARLRQRRQRRSPPAHGPWACSSPSGRGSASRWRRTTARSPATPRRSSRWPCTSRSSASGIFYTITSWAALSRLRHQRTRPPCRP